ncbi:MAG TPA: DUF4249 domain-containing protein [Bacteroidia bacterium]|nr:DUF4249 domain-containing protein [Bacteroidia bacterium]
MKRTHILFSILAFASVALFSSCEEVIDYDLDTAESKLVIDGLISDQPGPYYVKLSLTAPYLKNEPTARVSGALVIVKDDLNNVDTLKEELPGNYKTSASFPQGQVGRTYSLLVSYKGKNYTASGKILPVANIDSLSYIYRKEGVSYPEDGYYVTMYAQEPAGQGNSYRFKFLQNGYFSNRSDRFVIANDEFVDGNYITFTTPFPVNMNDTIVLEGQSLTPEAYLYYMALVTQMNPNGFFDSPPANLPTNISGGALGYFNTVAIKYRGIRIK